MNSINEPDVSVFDDIIGAAKRFSDVALFVLSRDGGENERHQPPPTGNRCLPAR